MGWFLPPTLLVVASNDIVILAGFPGMRKFPVLEVERQSLGDDGLAFEESDITYSSSNDMECRRTKVER